MILSQTGFLLVLTRSSVRKTTEQRRKQCHFSYTVTGGNNNNHSAFRLDKSLLVITKTRLQERLLHVRASPKHPEASSERQEDRRRRQPGQL